MIDVWRVLPLTNDYRGFEISLLLSFFLKDGLARNYLLYLVDKVYN